MSIPPFLALPPGVNARTIETRHGAVAALDADPLTHEPLGTVLLVPGFTGSKEDFIAVLAPLGERGVRAVAIDLPGQYETPWRDEDEASLAGFAAVVSAVAETLPRPLALVGHSFGGLVVREAVLSNPLAFDAVALIASGPASIPPSQQDVLRRFTEMLAPYRLDAVWQAKQTLDAAAGVERPAPELDDFLTKRFLSNAPDSLNAMIEALCTAEDQTDLLAAVAPTTAVVVGGLDDVWPLDEQRSMAERLDATLVELPASGHSPAVDEPDAVADALTSLLVDATSRKSGLRPG